MVRSTGLRQAALAAGGTLSPCNRWPACHAPPVSLLLALLMQTPPSGEVIDLTTLVPPACPKGQTDEIVVCGRAGESPHRLKPLPRLPDKNRVAGPGIGTRLAPNLRANAYGETVAVEGGGQQSNRAMIRLTLDF